MSHQYVLYNNIEYNVTLRIQKYEKTLEIIATNDTTLYK